MTTPAVALSRCPRCGGSLAWDGACLVCIWCGREVAVAPAEPKRPRRVLADAQQPAPAPAPAPSKARRVGRCRKCGLKRALQDGVCWDCGQQAREEGT